MYHVTTLLTPPCLYRKQYRKMMKSAKKFGTESTVMKPQSGAGRQMVQAYVVPRHEILTNPAFADLREREGLGDGTSGVSGIPCHYNH